MNLFFVIVIHMKWTQGMWLPRDVLELQHAFSDSVVGYFSMLFFVVFWALRCLHDLTFSDCFVYDFRKRKQSKAKVSLYKSGEGWKLRNGAGVLRFPAGHHTMLVLIWTFSAARNFFTTVVCPGQRKNTQEFGPGFALVIFIFNFCFFMSNQGN